MSKYKGNIVSATQTVLSGANYTGKANGVFKLAEQIQAKQSSLWAKGLTLPLAPTINTATFGNTNASVAFTAPSDTGGTSVLDYTVTSTPGNFTTTGASSPLTVTGLTNGTNYTFTVRARNSQGNSPESAASNSTGVTIPGVPTIGTAVYGDASATVNFTAPASNGGSAILDYTVTSTPGNFTATGTGTSIVVTGLTNGTSYTFKVKARNIVGSSPESAASNSIIPTGYTVPDAPTMGTVVQPSYTGTSADFTFSIPFTAPANTGGQPILDYTATSSLGTTVTGTTSPLVFTGVTSATSNITFTVKARNSTGSSVASATSAAVNTPPSLGQAWQGGYFGGIINDGGVNYFLIVAPKATGQVSGRVAWGINGVTTGATSTSNGKTNTDTLAALGSAYAAAYFCKNLTIGGFTDWYLPARYEQNIIYYWLKPSISNNVLNVYAAPNNIVPGVNPNAVFPMPINTAFTASVPTQTTVGLFKDGTGAEAYNIDYEYWESTEVTSNTARAESFASCHWNRISEYFTKAAIYRARAIRRIVAW